jgi:two-component system OmpR family sensor kinase
MTVGEPLSAILRTRYDEARLDAQPVVATVRVDDERRRERRGRPMTTRRPDPPTGLPSSAIHELRTPLTSIHGYAQVLQRGLADNPRASNALSVIVRESGRLTQMLAELSDVADLTEPPDPSTTPARTDVDLREVAEIVAETVTERDQAGHEIVVAGQARTFCDGQRLAQALAHIVTNAVLYSPPGTRVSVSLDDGDDCARVYVADEGIGIADADAERIYRPFERGANARELGARGLGLGLFIARQALDAAAGGTLTHVARPAVGTVFVLELPRT